MPGLKCYLWKAGLAIALFAASCSNPEQAHNSIADLTQTWRTGDPAQFGLDTDKLAIGVHKAAGTPRMGSLLVVKDGVLVLEEYFNGNHVDSLNDVRFVTKSILATLVGIALEEGFINNIDESIGTYLHPHVVDLRADVQAITIRNLLSMTAGFEWQENGGPSYNQWILSGDHIGFVVEKPLVSTPGTNFTYNTGAAHLLGVVLQSAVNMSLPEFADEYFFDKIGIIRKDWERFDQEYVNGGSGIDLRPRDLARLGQLYLQNGHSGVEQVVPEHWIEEVTTSKFSWRAQYYDLKSYTYGFLWWIEDYPDHPLYFAWGYGGQYIFVSPDLKMVVVATTDWRFLSLDGGPQSIENAVLEIVISDIFGSIE